MTRVASENRGGGWVKCWVGVTAWLVSSAPSSSSGSVRSSSSSAVRVCDTCKKPGNFRIDPVERNRCSPLAMSIEV